jgi:NAD(P)-dependent dehydrogenase (short-subunit alcohol dehydrogenase family)
MQTRVGIFVIAFLTQKLLPHKNDGGRIVNISSGLARFAGAPRFLCRLFGPWSAAGATGNSR